MRFFRQKKVILKNGIFLTQALEAGFLRPQDYSILASVAVITPKIGINMKTVIA